MATKKKVVSEVKEARDSQIRDYELVLVVNPEVVDEALDTVITGINQFITGKKGVIGETAKWGKKRLAYPIKRFIEGNYVLTRFKMSPEWSKELESNLRISELVLRHLLIRLDV